MEVAVFTKEEIQGWIEAAAAETAKKFQEALRRLPDKPYMTKRELMALTGWSSRQVEYKKAQGQIPFIRRDRLVLFPTDEFFPWLEAGRVPAKE